MSRKLIEAEVITRAWNDDAFRAKLETDPAAALTEAGFPLPHGKTVKIMTEAPDSLTLVIPPIPAQTEEINDDELAAVAGGGLIDSGKCELHEKSRTDAASRFALGIGAVVGASWFWG